MKSETFPIRAYSPKQLAQAYRCSMSTLRKWLKAFEDEIGPRIGHIYTPKQVLVIVQRLGPP